MITGFYLTQLIRKSVIDAKGEKIGRLSDLIVDVSEYFPKVTTLVISARAGTGLFALAKELLVPVNQVESFGEESVLLKVNREEISQLAQGGEELFLLRDILDKQIIDVYGRKIVRVNDIQLVRLDGDWRVLGVDIGLRGLLRRLGAEGIALSVAKFFALNLREKLIPWPYVEPLEIGFSGMKLKVPGEKIKELHPADLAEIISLMEPEDRMSSVLNLSDETLAEALPELEPALQTSVFDQMDSHRASDILELMPSDEAADVIGDLLPERANELLKLMEPEEAEEVKELLKYPEDSAGGIMATEFIAFGKELKISECIERLRTLAPDAETVYYLYVTDITGKLVGVVSLRDLITASPETLIDQVMRLEVISVNVLQDRQEVASLISEYRLLALPVVDNEDNLLGIVTVDDVLDVLAEEEKEDVSVLAGKQIDDLGTGVSAISSFLHRLPWSVISLVSGLLVAFLLRDYVSLPPKIIFPLISSLPLLIGLSSHISGQTATILNQALEDKGTKVKLALKSELIVTTMISVPIALLFFLIGFLVQEVALGEIISLSIFINLLIAYSIGAFAPLFSRAFKVASILVLRPLASALVTMIAPLVCFKVAHLLLR